MSGRVDVMKVLQVTPTMMTMMIDVTIGVAGVMKIAVAGVTVGLGVVDLAIPDHRADHPEADLRAMDLLAMMKMVGVAQGRGLEIHVKVPVVAVEVDQMILMILSEEVVVDIPRTRVKNVSHGDQQNPK